ncbi:MAG: HAMP domain-containing sensor histidine kinase [Erysipelotrichaceae bacterium]
MKERINKIQTKIVLYLFAFIGIMIFLLWMFQIVFLQDFYKFFKTRDIKRGANAIAQNLDNKELPTILSDISNKNDMCINVIDDNGNMLFTPNKNCQLTAKEINTLYNDASDSNGTALQIRRINEYNAEYNRVNPKEEQLSYIKLIEKDSNEVAIVLNARITPVGATVETLRSLLILISFILIVVALIIAYGISKKISKPIVNINEGAKELATGNYDVEFSSTGYEEIQELSNTLNYAAKELNKVETFRKDLIANISHDLRTPLTMIAGYGEVMRDLPNENNKENIQIIIDETNRLTNMVNDMLDLSKLQAGVLELNCTTFNLSSLIRDMVLRYMKLLNDESYRIEFNSALPATDELNDVEVYADEGKISQVLYNLLNNAITYSGDSKLVEIKQTVINDQVKIEVIDKGNGIEEDQLEHIWDRYYKSKSNHKRSCVGSGLGLSIVKSIMNLHGTNFGVKTEVGVGSSFYFYLNIKK